MRKTTDPKERKYLTDREFNAFGRGAVEDAPAELLYGKGALAEALNINCYPQYFEGRTGSEVFTKKRTPAVSPPRRYSKDGNQIEALPEEAYSEPTPLYLDWVGDGGDEDEYAEGYRDVVAYINHSGAPRTVESSAPRHSRGRSGLAVVRDRPSLTAWHDTIMRYVRVEGGRFYTRDNAKDEKDLSYEWVEVFMPERLVHGRTLGRERCSFIPDKTGGFLYTKEGIYRWINGENVLVKINIGAPLVMPSMYDVDTVSNNITAVHTDHLYRYEFTGLRLRGKGRIEDPSGTVVDFETPVSEHNFLSHPNPAGHLQDAFEAIMADWDGTGVFSRRDTPPVPVNGNFGPISTTAPALIEGFRWTEESIGTATHIGVYRTLDLQALDADAPSGGAFNSPNALGLVADVPMATVFFGRLNSFVFATISRDDPDEKYDAKMMPWDIGSVFKIYPYDRVSDLTSNREALRFRASPWVNNFEYIPNHGNPEAINNIPFLVYTAHSGCAFAVEVENETTVRWSGGMDINDHNTNGGLDSLAGQSIFLSDGEAYTIVSQDDGQCINALPADDRPLLTLSRPISGDPPTGRLYGAVVVTPGRERICDTVDDETLKPRTTTFYPRTRFRRPLPDCNVAAAVPGFVLSAIEGESALYYTDDEGMGGYTNGSHNPIQTNEQVVGGITHIEAFPDVAAIMTASATWTYVLGTAEYYTEPGSGWRVPVIAKINSVDNRIGCVFPRTVQRISGGEIIMTTQIGGEAAVVIFNGHQYGGDMLVDTALGLARNRNRARNAAYAVAIYGESTGYIVWMAMDWERGGYGQNPSRYISTYCFRVAVRATQGGGVTEYGGERWLWPDADGGATVTGHDGNGAAVALVEDARTGFLYQIGVAENWLDKKGLLAAEYAENPRTGLLFATYPAVGGYEIPTRAALPIIADGYKWQKHLETHIAMRCWKSGDRGAKGFTADGFKPEHKVGLKIYEDGEVIDEASALQDLNRNGDYAYLKKVEARRIQEAIETTTSAFKVSQVVVKVQTSDREALPVDNDPIEVKYQREWRTAVIHLSRNLPCPTYNRADGTEMEVKIAWGGGKHPQPGEMGRTKAPTGKPCEAFWTSTSLIKTLEADVIDFTASMWIRPSGAGDLIAFRSDTGAGEDAHEFTLSLSDDGEGGLIISCSFDETEILRWPLDFDVWQYVALRRKVNGTAELISLFVDGVNVANSKFATSVQGTVEDLSADADADAFFSGITANNTFDEGPSLQKTTDDPGSLYVGREVAVGQGRNTEYYDVRLMLSAVSAGSIKTYYDAVLRGGEGWLP